jgi:hypothetical protein
MQRCDLGSGLVSSQLPGRALSNGEEERVHRLGLQRGQGRVESLQWNESLFTLPAAKRGAPSSSSCWLSLKFMLDAVSVLHIVHLSKFR